MWDWVAAGLEAKAAATAGEVLVMRADILLNLIAGRLRLLERARRAQGQSQGGGGAGRPRDGQVTQNPDGTRTIAIQSLDSLRAFLGGGVR